MVWSKNRIPPRNLEMTHDCFVSPTSQLDLEVLICWCFGLDVSPLHPTSKLYVSPPGRLGILPNQEVRWTVTRSRWSAAGPLCPTSTKLCGGCGAWRSPWQVRYEESGGGAGWAWTIGELDASTDSFGFNLSQRQAG